MHIKQTFLAVLELSALCAAGPIPRRQSRVEPTDEDASASSSRHEDEIVLPLGVDYSRWPLGQNHSPWSKRSVSEEKTDVKILYEQPVSAEVVYGEVIVPGPNMMRRSIPEKAAATDVSHASMETTEIATENSAILSKRGFKKVWCNYWNPFQVNYLVWWIFCKDHHHHPKVPDQFNLYNQTEFGMWVVKGQEEGGAFKAIEMLPGVEMAWDGDQYPNEKPKEHVVIPLMHHGKRSEPSSLGKDELTQSLLKRGFKKVWCSQWNPVKHRFVVTWIDLVLCHQDPAIDPQFNLADQTEFGRWVVEQEAAAAADGAYEVVEMQPGGQMAWDYTNGGLHLRHPYPKEVMEQLAPLKHHGKRSEPSPSPSSAREDFTQNIFKHGLKSVWCSYWNPARLNTVVKWINMRVCAEDSTPRPDGQFNLFDETEFGIWVMKTAEDENSAAAAGAPYEVMEIPPGGGELAWDYPDGNPHHRHGGGYPKEVMELFAPLKHQREKRAAVGGEVEGKFLERRGSMADDEPWGDSDAPDSFTSRAVFAKREEHPYGLLAKCIFSFGFACFQHPGDKWFPNPDGTMPAQTGWNDYKDVGGACNGGNWVEGCRTKNQWE